MSNNTLHIFSDNGDASVNIEEQYQTGFITKHVVYTLTGHILTGDEEGLYPLFLCWWTQLWNNKHSWSQNYEFQSEGWKITFIIFLLLSFPERNQLALVIKLFKCRLTSLVYHLAFHLELLFEESVAILLLGLQAPVKKVKTKIVACSNPTSEFQG